MGLQHYHGILYVILLILDLWAIISVVNSNRSVSNKLLWTLLILVLPLLGFIIWLIMGPRARRI